MADLRSMMLDHIQTYGEAPNEEKILQHAFGKLGTPFGTLQGHTGRMAKYVVHAAKPIRPIVRGMDIFKELGVK